MEKRLFLFMLLSFVLMWIWMGQAQRPPEKKEGAPAKEGPSEPDAPAPEPGVAGEAPALPDSESEEVQTVDYKGHEDRSVDRKRIRWTFNEWGGSLRSARLKEFAQRAGQDLDDEENWYEALCSLGEDRNRRGLADPRRSLALEIVAGDADLGDEPLFPLGEVLWTDATPPDVKDRVVYEYVIKKAGVRLTKEFRFPEEEDDGDYNVDLVLRVKVLNAALAKAAGIESWRYRLIGAAGVPRQPFQPPVVGSALTTRDSSVEEFSASERWEKTTDEDDWPKIETHPESDDREEDEAVVFVGVHNRFFGGVLMPKNPGSLGNPQAVLFPVTEWMWTSRGEECAVWAAAIDFDLPVPAEGAVEERRFLFFVGPMDPDLLSEGPYAKLEPIIDYGFFGPIVELLVLLLGGIHSLVGNWGLAIIFLTLLIRMAMFPLSRKSQVAMQRYQRQMGRLKPKIEKIKERHGKNRRKMNEETMKLYREEGVRMFPAGCLIMFLQLPIFIGLFQALRYSIGLRHSSFLWASDLTAPDQLVHLDLPSMLPDYLNVFPILMGVTWYLSTAMAPKPVDPQQQSTQKMMKWMPIIFSIMLYNYSAGLALYMVISSSWSIFEAKVVRKVFGTEDAAQTTPGPTATFRKGR